jgi:putative membrane protein insertion efficiency factor
MKLLALKLIRFYQRSFLIRSRILKTLFLSDASCRFRPTCSEYTYQAIEGYGIILGSAKSLGRILRCHPWSKGGYDPVK